METGLSWPYFSFRRTGGIRALWEGIATFSLTNSRVPQQPGTARAGARLTGERPQQLAAHSKNLTPAANCPGIARRDRRGRRRARAEDEMAESS